MSVSAVLAPAPGGQAGCQNETEARRFQAPQLTQPPSSSDAPCIHGTNSDGTRQRAHAPRSERYPGELLAVLSPMVAFRVVFDRRRTWEWQTCSCLLCVCEGGPAGSNICPWPAPTDRGSCASRLSHHSLARLTLPNRPGLTRPALAPRRPLPIQIPASAAHGGTRQRRRMRSPASRQQRRSP